jgi:hypothetical protein
MEAKTQLLRHTCCAGIKTTEESSNSALTNRDYRCIFAQLGEFLEVSSHIRTSKQVRLKSCYTEHQHRSPHPPTTRKHGRLEMYC